MARLPQLAEEGQPVVVGGFCFFVDGTVTTVSCALGQAISQFVRPSAIIVKFMNEGVGSQFMIDATETIHPGSSGSL